MRTRSSTSAPVVPCSNSYSTIDGNCVDPRRVTGTYPIVTSYVPLSETWTMHDYVTKSYRRRSKKGEIINNPFDSQKITTVQTLTSISGEQSYFFDLFCSDQTYHTDLVSGTSWTGSLPSGIYVGWDFLPAPVIDVSRVIDIATTQAWAKADVSEVQGLVILGEGHKTISFFADTFKRLLKLGRQLKHVDVKGLRRQLSAKELSNRYMEARYAIRPLIYDMRGCVKAFQAPKHPKRVTFRSSASDSSTIFQNNVETFFVPNACRVLTNKSASRHVVARSGVLAAITEISNASLWGFNQPIEALWELVPFSFVVDWFCNVGKTIASWTPKPGLETLASWCVVVDTTVATNALASSQSLYTHSRLNKSSWKPSGGFVSQTTVSKYRIVNPNRAIVPSFNVKLDGLKLLDLAIMAKRFF